MSGLNSKTDNDTIKEALYPPPTYSAASRAIMGQTTKISAQATREQVDQRIAQLESEIRALKTHRNMVADTSLFPPEILSNIFIILRRLIGTGHGYYYTPPASWAHVTHVCRHWRAVALDCPALWSELLFVSPKTTEMMLQRSKNAPLTVKFTANLVRYHDILCKIVSQTGRLRDFELQNRSSTGSELLKTLSGFESTAPTLEKLVLHGVPVGYGGQPYTLPENFLRDGAPSLRHLEVTQFAIRWDALPLSSSLTHLRLQNTAPENRPPRKAFLESMANLLRLETLKLFACLPRSGDVSHPSRSLPVTLPSLRTLELHDSVAELCQFFRATQISKEARVNIELGDVNPESESLGALFSAFKTSWSLCQDMQDMESVADGSLAQSEILDLRIVNNSGQTTSQIKCWYKDHELPPPFNDENPPANLVVSSKNSGNSRVNTSLLTAIAEHLDFSSLCSLKIAPTTDMTEEALGLFKDLTKLDTITIARNHRNLSRFLKALKKDGASPGTPSFPTLCSVNLHRIDFDEERNWNADIEVRDLINALDHREGSCPIDELSITQCINFTEAHWDSLRESLPEQLEMEWDEDEDIREPSEHDEVESDYGMDWYDPGVYDYDYW
ncbi:hypothetical protein EST38_g5865 [Candolleomyces aberdarensis]|uniref:F-box domain-containing protein n=1 Tax=Candolleomyces aberdarensis TaxID=2316362 RepID=A0A4V1Q3W4_9AGAR|nr:hypothetical protein EST38_g5865 [Candolleomyces aberdarensis]